MKQSDALANKSLLHFWETFWLASRSSRKTLILKDTVKTQLKAKAATAIQGPYTLSNA